MVVLRGSRSTHRQTHTPVRALRSSLLGATMIASSLTAAACRGGDPGIDSTAAQYGVPQARDTARAQAGLASPFSRLAAAIRGSATSDTAAHR